MTTTPTTTTTKPSRSKRSALTLLSLGLVGVIMGVLVWRERAALLALDPSRAWPALVVGQITVAAGLLLAGALWASILHSLGSRAPRLRHINIYATTYLQRYLPGTVWYVVGRGLLYRDEGDSARLVTVASGVELMLTVMSGALVNLVLLIVAWRQAMQGEIANALFASLVASLVVAALSVALLHPATLRWAMRRLKMEETPLPPLRKLAGWLAWYAVNWLTGGLVLAMNARFLLGAEGANLPVAYIMLAWSVAGTLSFLVFFLPSNFGLQEIGISLLLSAVMPSSVAVMAALLTRLLLTLYSALGCLLLSIVTGRLLRRAQAVASPAAPPPL